GYNNRHCRGYPGNPGRYRFPVYRAAPLESQHGRTIAQRRAGPSIVRAAARGVRAPSGRARAQEQSFHGEATSRTRSENAPKTRTNVTPAPKAGAPAPPPAPAAEVAVAAPPPPSACQARLTPDIALAHALPSITGPGSCG